MGKKMKYFLIFFTFLSFAVLSAFPNQDYDFHLPTSGLSPYEAAAGGINLTDNNNQFATYSNPALLKTLTQTTFALSFSVPPRKKSFTEMLKTNPLLEKSVFRGVNVQTRQAGFYYQIMADEHIDKTTTDYYEYKDFTLKNAGVCFADTSSNLNWGIGLKYLNGRMVYLKEMVQDSLSAYNQFVDSKANGYSFDMGIYRQYGGFHVGFVVYDVYSKLYWEDQKNAKLRTRGAFSVELRGNNLSLAAGTNSLWNIHEKPFYNQSIRYVTTFYPSKKNPQSMGFGMGICSKDFKNRRSTLFTYGISYFMSYLRIDVAIQSQGWIANNSQYLFSVALGE